MDHKSFYHQLLNEAVEQVNPGHWVVHPGTYNDSIPAYKFTIAEDNKSWIKNDLASAVFVSGLAYLTHNIGPCVSSEEIWLNDPTSLDKIVEFLQNIKELDSAPYTYRIRLLND